MKIIQLPDFLHDYLLRLIEAHAARGIHPEEGMALGETWLHVSHAMHIPDPPVPEQTGASGTGTAMQEQKPECQICFEEEGSLNCIRPAHQQARAADSSLS